MSEEKHQSLITWPSVLNYMTQSSSLRVTGFIRIVKLFLLFLYIIQATTSTRRRHFLARSVTAPSFYLPDWLDPIVSSSLITCTEIIWELCGFFCSGAHNLQHRWEGSAETVGKHGTQPKLVFERLRVTRWILLWSRFPNVSEHVRESEVSKTYSNHDRFAIAELLPSYGYSPVSSSARPLRVFVHILLWVETNPIILCPWYF